MSKGKKIIIPTEEEVRDLAGEGAAPQGGAENTSAGDSREQASAESVRSEAEEYKDKYLRAVAELSNFRKRAEKDREESLRYASAALARSLLPVLDNLERVLASADSSNANALIEGVKLTLESFHKAMSDARVTRIEAQGQPFDPAVHEAMMQQPSDAHPDKSVLQVVQEGYKLYDRVLRPARVIVSKAPETDTPPPAEGGEE